MTVTNPITGLGASIQRQSTTEQATEAVRQAILSGRLPPGMPLREVAVAAELGVSRGTLREAARTLESEGLVSYRMNRGIVVADVTGPDVADIYAARAAVELTAADALTAHRDPVLYQNLADLVDRIERAFESGDTADALDGDRLFHATLVTATGSPRLSPAPGQGGVAHGARWSHVLQGIGVEVVLGVKGLQVVDVVVAHLRHRLVGRARRGFARGCGGRQDTGHRRQVEVVDGFHGEGGAGVAEVSG